jgi:hypothetical protein
MTLNKEPTTTWEGSQGNVRCEHDYAMLVVETKAGYYYARCSGFLTTGPERLNGEAARKSTTDAGSEKRNRHDEVKA